MKALSHVLVVAIIVGLFLGIPAVCYVDFQALATGNIDAMSSATAIQDAPSGSYTVCINANKHKNAEELEKWKAFFKGEDVSLIMEDISCVVPAGDVTGMEMAKSLQSRLPENQMKLRYEEGTLALSRADEGLFDTIVMSDEAAGAYGASSREGRDDVVVVHR